jgi:tetratricopeptide (TPR) repeat protein
LHTASVILLFLILRRMTGALWRSAFVAAVFAIHPLRVESVAWVAERKDVLGGLFFMLTLWAYARYAECGMQNHATRHTRHATFFYLLTLLCFALGLLSKPTVVTLPFVLLLLDYWPLGRMPNVECRMRNAESRAPRPAPRQGLSFILLEKIPLLALTAGACALTLWAEGAAVAARANVSVSARLANALVSNAIYLRQMIWPAGLAPFYPLKKGYPVWTITLSFLVLATITGGVLALRRKRPWLLTGWFWYLGMLTPMIGLVQVGAFAHADRVTYLPQIGLYLMLTWAAAELSAAWPGRRVALGGLAAIILLALMLCARTQTGYWRDNEALWTHALACTTDNDMAHAGLARVLLQKGKTDEAIGHYQTAVQINPDNADAHKDLGSTLLKKGRVDEAIAQFLIVLRLHPGYAPAHNDLGLALLQKGKVDEAIVECRRALEINPHFAQPHYTLGLALSRKGDWAEAIAQYQKVLQLKSPIPEVQNNLAWLLATAPDVSLRNGGQAVELARQANERAGGKDPVILHTLAAAYAETGRFRDAISTAQTAMELAHAAGQPDLAAQLSDEIKHYEQGLPLHP